MSSKPFRPQESHGLTLITYTNRRYSLPMRYDGAIRVKHGDWLSKYSAALHNDFTRVHEYGRIGNFGQLSPIRDINLIYAGETIYHLPTYGKAKARILAHRAGAEIINDIRALVLGHRVVEETMNGIRARVLGHRVVEETMNGIRARVLGHQVVDETMRDLLFESKVRMLVSFAKSANSLSEAERKKIIRLSLECV